MLALLIAIIMLVSSTVVYAVDGNDEQMPGYAAETADNGYGNGDNLSGYSDDERSGNGEETLDETEEDSREDDSQPGSSDYIPENDITDGTEGCPYGEYHSDEDTTDEDTADIEDDEDDELEVGQKEKCDDEDCEECEDYKLIADCDDCGECEYCLAKLVLENFGNAGRFFGIMPAMAMIPIDHVVGNGITPAESPVENFTVGFAGNGDYRSPINEFWQNGRNANIFFVTGDPNRASEHGLTITVTYQNQNFDAEVIYISRIDIPGVGGGAGGAPSVPLFDVSPLPNFVNNSIYFFDEGNFVDTDDFSVVNRFAGTSGQNNRAFVGLYRDANGEPLTTFYKVPAGLARGANIAGFMARTVFNAPNIHIENIIWDGSGIDMVRNAQSSRGEYFWFISTNATDFVVRDVILQNIGNRTTLTLIENLSGGNHRKNVAINIFTAGSLYSGTEGSQRNFENLTIRNVRTMSGYGIIQFNRTSGNYFYNLNVANPNADGTGIAHSTAANTYPIKIEHRPIGSTTAAAPNGNTITGNQVAERQSNFVFAGTLTVPNHANSAVYIQDYRYKNILLPADFTWALLRTSNGGDNTAAMRVYNHKRPQTSSHALLQLDTGYWVVENQTAAPNLQTQLNNINSIINVNNPGGATPWTQVPQPNIKMIANGAGTLPGFTIPNFRDSHAGAIIVALIQTSTPSLTVHAANAHASGISAEENAPEFVLFAGGANDITLPSNNTLVRIFNFDFKNHENTWWTIEEATGIPEGENGNIVNFMQLNSGRNLFVQYTPLQWPVTFMLNGGNVGENESNITHNIDNGELITLANVPNPERLEHDFEGWQEINIDGQPVGVVLSPEEVAALGVTGGRTFRAVWREAEPILPQQWAVRFILNGGNIDGDAGNITYDINDGERITQANVPYPERNNYEFDGWRETDNDMLGVLLTPEEVAELVVRGSMTFIAQWRRIEPELPVQWYVTFILDGGNVDGYESDIIREINDGGFITQPNVPHPYRYDFIFTGWWERDNNGMLGSLLTWEQVAAMIVTGPRTFIAQWTPRPYEPPYEPQERPREPDWFIPPTTQLPQPIPEPVPVTPDVPVYVEAPVEAPEVTVYGIQEEELPTTVRVYAYETDDDDILTVTENIEARVNPQTEDNTSILSLLASALGLIVSVLGIIFVRRRIDSRKSA